MAGDSGGRRPKRDPYLEAYEAARAQNEKSAEELREDAAGRYAANNEGAKTAGYAWTMFAAKRTQEIRFVSSALALVLALAGEHWPFFAFLLLVWTPTRHVRGYVGVFLLLYAATFVVGIAFGLPALAMLGGLVPGVATVILRGVTPRILGAPTSLVRDPYFGMDSRQRDVLMLNHKLEGWQERIRAAPSDAVALERVVLEMRDWDMTSSQATRVASHEGAPRVLLDEIVATKVYWPRHEHDDVIDVGWKWERAISARYERNASPT